MNLSSEFLKALKKGADTPNMMIFLVKKEFQYDTGAPAGVYFLRNR